MNDLHSRFENMPKIATYIKKVKELAAEKGEHVIVVDLGDHMDRMQLETEGTGGKVNVEILNQFGTDVATIGNNEGLTFTKELLQEAYKNKQFEVVACNIKDRMTKQVPDWFKEYWIQEIGNIKIAWIGATAPYDAFYRLQGWEVEDPLISIRKIIQTVKSQVDLIILLSHLGIRADEYIAETLTEIDVILGAHTHRFLEQGIKRKGQPLICQVGIFGDFIGHLYIDYEMEKKKIIRLEERTVDIRPLSNDIDILQIIEEYRKKAKKEMNKPVAFLDQPLTISLDEETSLGNLLADGVRRWTNADIALVNTGQILEGLEQGTITKERIHQICPSPINTCSVTLNGKLIKTTLEQSLLDDFIYKSFKGFGFRGKELGSLSVSGLTIFYNPMSPPYQKIEQIYVNDQLLEEEKEYKVGTLDMFTFGGGYYLIKEGKDIQYFLPEFLRDILSIQLMNKTSVQESFQLRWQKVNEKDRVT